MHEITIGEVRSPAELEEWQAVEAAVWPGSPPEMIPSHVLLTHQRYGGLLLGAREPGGSMIGILLGFPGLKGGRVVHCSHLLGVLPEWRSRDVGYLMKCCQRDFVLALGLDLVVWTFDPLETRNARLNIGRLGGICREYHRNLYGVMNDGLNQGLESDRFTIYWHIRHQGVADRLERRTHSPEPVDLRAAGVPLLTHTEARQGADGGEYLRLEDVALGRDGSALLVEAPAYFQAVKAADLGAALAWREGLRAVFQDLLGRGYAVLDLLREQRSDGSLRCYYLIGHPDRYD
jgi:predicted GNAT superfamily acetyltransferase